jgi:hypothetical protein
MALTTVGALALALLFASLSRRLPADGGPYAYALAAGALLLGIPVYAAQRRHITPPPPMPPYPQAEATQTE